MGLVCYLTQTTGNEKRKRKLEISSWALHKTNKAQLFEPDVTLNRTKSVSENCKLAPLYFNYNTLIITSIANSCFAKSINYLWAFNQQKKMGCDQKLIQSLLIERGY